MSFAMGYLFFTAFIGKAVTETPYLLGLRLNDASTYLENLPIAIAIRSIVIDDELPSGTIVSQAPEPGCTIKIDQSIYIVVTQQSPAIRTPKALLLKKEEIYPITESLKIPVHESNVIDNRYIENSCIGQYPPAATPLSDKDTITLYFAIHKDKPVLMPNFKGIELTLIKDLLTSAHLPFSLLYHGSAQETDLNLKIVDQRPRAGCFITIHNNSPHVHLLVGK